MCGSRPRTHGHGFAPHAAHAKTKAAIAVDKKYALVDAHGECFGFYDDRSAAEADLEELGGPDDLGIIEVDKQPTKRDYLEAVRNWMAAVINHRWR